MPRVTLKDIAREAPDGTVHIVVDLVVRESTGPVSRRA